MKWLGALVFLVGCSDDHAPRDVDATATSLSDTAVRDASEEHDMDVETVTRRCETVASGAGARLEDRLGVATVAIAGDPCARRYTLASSATRRDDRPASPRVITEDAADPLLRSGNDMLDALYALALAEAREDAVASVSDGAMTGNQTVACPAPGCWTTGELWTYVWTRDTAYAIDLGLAALDPARAAAALRFKLSDRRAAGGNPGTQIVQDTGSGGSYPVSSDRVVWALGADQVLANLDGDARTSFRDAAWVALRNTVEHDRRVVFDPALGLYRGEQSFLDWREQSYPAHTASDVVDIADGVALSTNVLHLHALDLAARLAGELGEDGARDTYLGWADALRSSIRERFWLEDAGLFATLLPTTLDRAPVQRFDLLGEALAITEGVATPAEAARMVAAYPAINGAFPVLWPQQQLTRIYHNRATWPFVSAYWLCAARVADNGLVARTLIDELMRGAALNLSHLENREVASGAPWVDDGDYSGPVVDSRRQLWSIGGFLALVQRVLFGLEATADGLAVAPWIAPLVHERLFTNTDRLVLNDYRYLGRRLTVTVKLPPLPADPAAARYRVAEVRLDGVVVTGVIPAAQLHDGAAIDVTLAAEPTTPATMRATSDADWHDVFGPREPTIAVAHVGDHLELTLTNVDGDMLHIYRDGVLWQSVAGASTLTDDLPERTRCYSVDASFANGNRSQRSAAACWWGDAAERIQVVPAAAFEAVGGSAIDAHGRFHYQAWGKDGDSLTARAFRPRVSGPHLVQVEYGNGAGPIDSGITCAVKRVQVIDEQGGAVVGDGVLVMPQLGTWDRWAYSTFVAVTLDASRSYRVVISADPLAVNMSAFELFARYSGTGGAAAFRDVNISELRVLAR